MADSINTFELYPTEQNLWTDKNFGWKWLAMAATTSNGSGSFDSDCNDFEDNDSLEKRQITPFILPSHVLNNFNGFITVVVKLGFSVANWLLKPNHVKNVKRHRADVCLGDNRHGSFRHRKEVLNPALVVVRKVSDRRSEIFLMIIWWLTTDVLVQRNMSRRIKRKYYFDVTSYLTHRFAIFGGKQDCPPFLLLI